MPGNANKYFIVQALQHDSGAPFHFWSRWGRVGERGQSSLSTSSVQSILAQFERKFRDKTGQPWAERHHFVSRPGKYTLLERDYSAGEDMEKKEEGEKEEKVEKAEKKEVKSALDERVQSLVSLICDVGMMRRQMMEVGYDANKLPLGKGLSHFIAATPTLPLLSSLLLSSARPHLTSVAAVCPSQSATTHSMRAHS